MIDLFRSFLAGLAAALTLASAASAAPLDAFGQLPQIQTIAISGDGTMLAMLTTDGKAQKIVVRRVDSNDGARLISAGEHKIYGLVWYDHDHLLIRTPLAPVTGTTTIGEVMVYYLPADKLLRWPGYGAAEIKHPEPVWPYDAKGEEAVYSTYYDRSMEWTIWGQDGSNHKPVAKGKHPYAKPRIVARGDNDHSVLVAMDEGQRFLLRQLDLNTGGWSQDRPVERDTSAFVNRQGELLGLQSWTGDSDTVEFNRPADRATWQSLQKSFKSQKIEIVDWSDDHRVLVLLLTPAKGVPAYFLVDMNTKEAKFIAGLYAGLTSTDAGLVRPIRYKAADGLEINGYLTTPPGREDAKGLPLVVLVHGGPEARDYPGFDWWAQGLASRGYAVLQANFRGSEGYGEAFLRAGEGQWGKKMQTDLSDGVRYLAGQGIIDPKRVCIAGASYGGYAALAGAAFDKGVYRCAVSVSGPTDLRKMFTSVYTDDSRAYARRWAQSMGVEGEDDKRLIELSPDRHADQIDIPVLLVHGKEDGVVPFEQSKFMADALKRAGKPVELVSLEKEDHNLSHGETRQQMLRSVAAFLEKCNPPD